ncbi:GH23581 [Drosophila grimshawi]|uniref:GH23581 n=1 Tax=Drosophila grimshawi TaxID=7222 RepID=B4K450_DROGR|nr:GH23581 [Drosophila grimshawi]
MCVVYSFIYGFYFGLAALECYACSYLLGQSDATCLTNASAVRALNCTKKYCLTVRQEAIVSILQSSSHVATH